MSKGSKQRPIEDKKKFDENWDKVFCKHEWVMFNDGDYGSYFYCKKCGVKQTNENS